jgi:polyisoprenoid-binding protein YceI
VIVQLVRRCPYLAVIPAGVALAAALMRWLVQGSGNVYTTFAKRFYIPDPDLGWRVADGGPIWVGLEAIGVLAGIAAGIAAGAWVIRRVERKRGRAWTPSRWALWVVACLPLAVPVAAFATGGRPAGAVEILPPGQTAAPPTEGIEGSLLLPAGTYRVQPGSAITARISAGKETFDARFAGDFQGAWQGDPGDLATAMTAELSVAAASVDTGLDLRSKHAREEYLYADKFPRAGFTLRRLVAARQDGPTVIVFRAEGSIALMGRDHPVEVTGTLRSIDAEGTVRLGLPRGIPALVVQADTELRVSQTPLAADRDSFDRDTIGIHVSLVLAPTNATTTE